MEKESFFKLWPESTVVTDRGTVIDTKTNRAALHGSAYSKCSLLTALLTKADELKLMTLDEAKRGDAHFDFSNAEAWSGHKKLFLDKDINEAAFELISLAQSDGENNHLARQLIPGILQQFCPNVAALFDKFGSVNVDGNDPRFEVVNSINDLLIQMKHHGNIQISKNEIPAIDQNGFLGMLQTINFFFHFFFHFCFLFDQWQSINFR